MADQLAGLAALLQTLGGNKTTTSAGNTDALSGVLGQLKGADYSSLLAGIFQQAGAEVPKLQVGLGNALGARSGNNSAVAAALQALLQQTTLAGQKQIAEQQLQNQQLQVQAGQGIANATRGTTVQSGTNMSKAAGTIAAMAALKKAVGGMGGLAGMFGGDTAAAPVTGAVQASTYPVSGGAVNSDMQVRDLAPLDMATQAANSSTDGADLTSALTQLFGVSSGDVQSQDLPLMSASTNETPAGPAISSQGSDASATPVSDLNFGDEWLSGLMGFADGGLVGRDGKKAALRKEDDAAEEHGEAVARTQHSVRFDEGFSANALLDTLQSLMGDNSKQVRGYADGGVVKAMGSRRSANPNVQQDSVDRLQSGISATELSNPNSNFQLVDMINALTGSSALSNPYQSTGKDSGAGAGTSVDPRVGSALSGAAALDSLSGITGGPSFAGTTGIGLGTLAGLANARGAADVMSQFGQLAASMVSPGLGAAFATGSSIADDNASKTANILAGLANPALGALNLVSSLLGGPTAGGLLMGTPAVTPVGYGPVTEATKGLAGNLGITSGGGSYSGSTAAYTSPVQGSGPITVSSLPSQDSGDTSGGGDSSGDGMANGGKVKGPGTTTSDSVPAMLSKGEYVIPADVVQRMGADFFDTLNKVLHTPAGAR